MTQCENRKFFFIRLALPPIPFVTWRPRFGKEKKRTFSSTSVAISDMLRSSQIQSSVAVSKVPLKPATDILAGALARVASQSTIHPLDTLKVRFQTRVGSDLGVSKFGKLVLPDRAGGVFFDLKQLGKSVGSVYKGVLGASTGAGIALGAYFAIYGASCNFLSVKTNLSPSKVAFVSGGVAAAGSSVVKVPLAVCIRSVQAGLYNNVFHAAVSIVKAAGSRGLFTGYLPTLLEDVPDMAIKFAAYESLRSVHKKVYKGRAASIQEDFAMGAVAGATAAAATTPLDVIKTNMMCTATMRPTMFSAAKIIYAQGGHAAFFRGLGARALSNGINTAVFFCFFEALRNHLKKQKEDELEASAQPLIEMD